MRLAERMRSFGRGVLGGLAGLGLLLGQLPAYAAPAPAPQPGQRAAAAAAPRPAIWLLEDRDTKIYLFGTTHVFERGFRWRSERLERVIREADELVMETADEDDIDGDAFTASMFMPKSVPLVARVSEPYRESLRQVIAASGMPEEMWDQLHTWAAGFMVMGIQMMLAIPEDQRGEADAFDGALSGAERELTDEFRRARRPISAVETSAQQFTMFRTLSLPAQRAFLESVLQPAGENAPEASAADASSPGVPSPGGDLNWASGNVDAIAQEMAGLPPELYEVLLTRRNRNWTEWLVRRLERPGTVLFAVGAGHLAGRDSVQSMLAARGFTARRID
jgi:uncharacterized protein YbaP (TraB family)